MFVLHTFAPHKNFIMKYALIFSALIICSCQKNQESFEEPNLLTSVSSDEDLYDNVHYSLSRALAGILTNDSIN